MDSGQCGAVAPAGRANKRPRGLRQTVRKVAAMAAPTAGYVRFFHPQATGLAVAAAGGGHLEAGASRVARDVARLAARWRRNTLLLLGLRTGDSSVRRTGGDAVGSPSFRCRHHRMDGAR